MSRESGEDRILSEIQSGSPGSCYLVLGETVIAEAVAARIAAAIGAGLEVAPSVVRRPVDLSGVLSDLRTFSLFAGGKVSVVIESAVLSDRSAAAYLVDQAAADLPIGSADSLSPKERKAAGRLLQVFGLFDMEPYADSPERALGRLPAWVFEGGAPVGGKKRRKRTKKQMAALLADLVALLAAAEAEGLEGFAETDASDLAELLDEGLPPGHHLVLAESAAAKDHPVVARLIAAGAVVEVATVQADRRGNWEGAGDLAAELERETGTAIDRDATTELARRTLRQSSDWSAAGATDRDSTSRFAAEYRKLASLATDGRIRRSLVEEVVQDRGQEDLWAVLDAIGAGRPREAADRLHRLLESAEDEMAMRLGFFSQLAQFCRHLTAVSGMMRLAGVPGGERNYNQFKSRLAPKLQGAVGGGSEVKPLAGLHPFRLHRAYLAASRMLDEELRRLPDLVLATEMKLKGESSNPDVALTHLVLHLARTGPRA
jgi:DNA polymerase III delta subunit